MDEEREEEEEDDEEGSEEDFTPASGPVIWLKKSSGNQ